MFLTSFMSIFQRSFSAPLLKAKPALKRLDIANLCLYKMIQIGKGVSMCQQNQAPFWPGPDPFLFLQTSDD